ncbi:oxalurate catabolism protein HpxZ [Rhodospirillaceae bacterium SYSU D60014]|uniref:oxalurate catabolism protein HpxZ n=1 Tax=Virgifigura deserti TaxID=2268457 RepID=UPI000E673B7F
MHEVNIPEIIAELTAVFQRYERALVTNNISELDALFWRSPLTIRFGASENLYGYDAIAAFRKARSPAGLQRVLSDTVITTFGRDFGTVNTLFHRDGQKTPGRQSQTWIRTEDGWRIVSAHVSLTAAG